MLQTSLVHYLQLIIQLCHFFSFSSFLFFLSFFLLTFFSFKTFKFYPPFFSANLKNFLGPMDLRSAILCSPATQTQRGRGLYGFENMGANMSWPLMNHNGGLWSVVKEFEAIAVWFGLTMGRFGTPTQSNNVGVARRPMKNLVQLRNLSWETGTICDN
jgi:hypothetical protein